MITHKYIIFIVNAAKEQYNNDKSIRVIYEDVDNYVAAEITRYLIENGVEVE